VCTDVLILVGLVAYSVSTNDTAEADQVPELVLRDDNHRLDTTTEGDVPLVEFLNSECEACGAAYPVIGDLRERYTGQVTFVLRRFPLDGHADARNAAHAVEAAARQGQLEPMYQRMFATQAPWG
jgi:protein-disulfide isomerase